MGKLRLLLAISVIIAHTTPIFGISLIGGIRAVHIFYIISGFYMSLILEGKYIGLNSYKLFITNRFLRIFPIYWAILFLTVTFYYFAFVKNAGAGSELLSGYIRYFGGLNEPWKLFIILVNIFLFGQNLIMFMGFGNGPGGLKFSKNLVNSTPSLSSFMLVPQAWTLAIEMCFYLIAPFFLRRSFKFVMTAIVIAFSLRFLIFYLGNNREPWNSRVFPLELGFFLLGNLTYRMYEWMRANNLRTIYYPIALLCSFLTIILFYHLPFKSPLLYGVLFFSLPVIFLGSKDNRLDRSLGNLSYPVYISHFLLMLVASYFKLPVTGFSISVSAILCSLLLNELVYKRIDLFRQNRLKVGFTRKIPILTSRLLEHSS